MKGMAIGIIFILASISVNADIYKDERIRVGWIYTNSEHNIIHVIGPINAKKGDVLDIRWQFAATNHKGFNIGLGSYVAIGGPPSTVKNVDGDRIIPAASGNITPDMHHEPARGSDLVILKKDYTDAYVKLVVYAMSTSYPDSTLSFHPNHGSFTVWHMSGN